MAQKRVTSKDNFELITYKLDSLQSIVTAGFERLDKNNVDLNKRLSILEIWQSRVDSDLININRTIQREQPNEENNKLIQIIVIVAGLVGTALTIILNMVKK